MYVIEHKQSKVFCIALDKNRRSFWSDSLQKAIKEYSSMPITDFHHYNFNTYISRGYEITYFDILPTIESHPELFI